MFWYNLQAARQLNSDLMRANAWHHRSDAVSSVIVLIGIAGSMAGYPVLDAVGAIGVSLLIGKIGFSLGWAGVRELVDTAATAEQRVELSGAIDGVEGVEGRVSLTRTDQGFEVVAALPFVPVRNQPESDGYRRRHANFIPADGFGQLPGREPAQFFHLFGRRAVAACRLGVISAHGGRRK